MRIGLLGCGRIGRVHARTLKGGDVAAELVAACDAVPSAAESLAAEHGIEVRDAEEIIFSSDIDAVVIGTPTDTHFDFILAAAKAGKAIFCEKPVDLSVERTRECVRAVEEAGVPFMTGFQRRFDPNFRQLRHRIRNGEIGNVETVTILSRDPSPPPLDYVRRSGGLYRDMMIHDFDMARFLFGEEFQTIYAVGSALVDKEIGSAGDVDTAAVVMTTPSGRICQIANSRRAAYGYDQRVEAHGERGLLRACNQMESTVEVATEAGFRRACAQHFFLERYETAYRAEVAEFAVAVAEGRSLQPGIRDGLRAQVLAEAATESRSSGQALSVALD